MSVKLNLIAAACENMGIGKNNDLPWKLRNEMRYFTRMTTETTNPNKKNVLLMGRKTWDAVPNKFKPFSNRINFVLSNQTLDLSSYKDTYCFKSLEDAIRELEGKLFAEMYENVWVIGGSEIYKLSMNSAHFYRLYLTEIKKHFDCDTFFPAALEDFNLKEVIDPQVPTGMQQEGDVEYVFKVYENETFLKKVD